MANLQSPGGELSPSPLNTLEKRVTHITTNFDRSYPKFLVICSVSNQLSTLSPFAIQKALLGAGGNPKSVNKLVSDDLLIETTILQSKSFLNTKTIVNIPAIVTPLRTLNSSRGVISEGDLINVSDQEILEGPKRPKSIICEKNCN